MGFRWAGWEPIVGNDIEPLFLETYKHNIHSTGIVGDIRDKHVFGTIVDTIERARRPNVPLLVLGGPPCQGFSTAGNRRSLNDKRNHLFNDFKTLVDTIEPNGFVFENVTGLLNMDSGAVFEMIRKELQILSNQPVHWILNAEKYAIPQRRTRLLLLSLPKSWNVIDPPPHLTGMEPEITLFEQSVRAISVRDALSDLPPLRPGEDGSLEDYVSEPKHPYQALMRSVISLEQYFAAIRDSSCVETVPA